MYPWGVSTVGAEEQLGIGQASASNPKLAGLGSVKVFKSLREEVAFCGIVFSLSEAEGEEKVVMVMCT